MSKVQKTNNTKPHYTYFEDGSIETESYPCDEGGLMQLTFSRDGARFLYRCFIKFIGQFSCELAIWMTYYLLHDDMFLSRTRSIIFLNRFF